MKSLYSKVLMLTLFTAVILAGIFCFQGVYTNQHDCMGETSFLLCDGIISHSTLISYALITAFFYTFLFLVAVAVVTFFYTNYRKWLQTEHIRLRARLRSKLIAPVLPLKIAFSKGIIHPYIP